MFKEEINSLSDISTIAAKFIQAYPNDRIFAFYGSMGAGKTTFVKALCEELKVLDYVTSPTFALINEYQTEQKGAIFHFDFYRIKSLSEAYDFGYEDYFYSGSYCFIEWPELIESLLPESTIKLHIKEVEGGSRILESN